MKLVWEKIDGNNWQTQEPPIFGGYTITKQKTIQHLFVLEGPATNHKDGIACRTLTKAKEIAKLLNERLDF